MKKILSAIVLAIILVGLSVSSSIQAVRFEKPKECCILSHDIVIGGASCVADQSVAPDATAAADCRATRGYCAVSKDRWGLFCVINSIMTITDWVFYILLVISVLMVIIGGFFYMTAAGDPEKAGKGKTIIVFAIIGLVIALLAKTVPVIVKYIVGV
ncbi:MAG: pilin [Patescibacteria group bacterium]|nr:pilin [Patescibacteria group bacterium]